MATQRFLDILEDINKNDSQYEMTPKELLNYFNCEKRTSGNTWYINSFLDKNNLEVIPHYEDVYLYSTVVLKHKVKARIHKDDKNLKNYDPVNRISFLPSANTKPLIIKRDADLSEAITVMMINDYSQLPVMNNDRDIDGMLTWKSIGEALIHKQNGKTVKDFMSKNYEVIEYDKPLFEAIKKVIESEVVIIRNNEKCICGIVTATDINQHYLKLTEPFLLLKEIENHIRIILDGKFTLDELRKFASSPDNNTDINSISDLTFGEYTRIIENPTKWEKLKLKIDRTTFAKRLHEVRGIRNNVMHFHPDGITENEERTLRDTALFFKRISELS
ncbi:CBS domain-containing protein [Epilithonimonas xixisoli]|uniref:CBS domain protein n=1 Tax=Epilithonimonas xixisoli TaxID=1476462 RepID=A0A4R8II57_9FLAO|nr:CBS domain-containing protein [Epilithonimonas xixisoli]TDX86565.1 CBS domain protein [Epilithonimonas xixisoli]